MEKRLAEWCEKYGHLMRVRIMFERKGKTEKAEVVQAEMEGMRFALWTLTGYIPENVNGKIIAKPWNSN